MMQAEDVHQRLLEAMKRCVSAAFQFDLCPSHDCEWLTKSSYGLHDGFYMDNCGNSRCLR